MKETPIQRVGVILKRLPGVLGLCVMFIGLALFEPTNDEEI